jgi:ABC-type amino acid transport system permease subunit
MEGTLSVAITGTLVLFAVSALLACALGLLLAAGSASRRRRVRYPARVAIDVTRGVPTSLLVIGVGIGMMRVPEISWLPAIYPGTDPVFQGVAWGVVGALALGLAGHLAEIFRSAREAVGHHRLDQADVLGLGRVRRSRLIVREAAAVGLAPTGSRLVHHLHNTAFAALFPVADLFGHLESEASSSFRVAEVAALGCLIYAGLSAAIWAAFRLAELALTHRLPSVPKIAREREPAEAAT